MSSSEHYPSSLDGTSFHEEGRFEKFFRKLRQEPLIPFGMALTCWALFNASKSIRKGDHHQTNRMFRARIYAQAFTLVCMVGGSVYYAEERSKRKEFESAVDERKAKEKQQAWIRELEARDQEDREIKAQRDAMLAARDQARAQGKETSDTFGIVKMAQEQEDRRRVSVLDAVMALNTRW